MPDTVLVTGGADSVGRVMAEAFAARGDRVHICDVQPDALATTLAANPGMRGTLADVGDPAALARTVVEATDWLDEISVLVNNVGIGGPRASIEDIALEAWERTLAVNVTAMFHAMKLVVPGMKRRGGGAIVNFSSGSTRTRLPGRSAYVVSKFAVEGLTLNAARELGPHGIRVNAILPGMIDNARMQGIVAAKSRETGRPLDAVEADYLRFISLRKKTQPADLAAMVLFLASDAGRLVTGELIAVSGNLEWED
ncbi:MAG: SDR family oxidoreductase [Alphaproteobacteria bacterium]|nr:SDR family oxidoreductase [Alphaproteobacteria bacterium]